MFGATTQPAKPAHNPNGDLEVATPQDLDSISSMTFSPTSDFFAVTSWNSSAYVWQYNQQGQTSAKAQNAGTQPVLASCWKHDGSGIFLGGCDKAVRLWDLGSNQAVQVALHDAPVRQVAWCPPMNLLITGSWDKTFRYWDTRSPTPAHTGQLPERVYAMDLRDDLLVIGTADRSLHALNVTQPQQIKTLPSQLKWQTRCVSVFPDKKGFLVGSIEGRVAVSHLSEQDQKDKNFTFKCHRLDSEIYSVNAMSFHSTFGTFVTAGSDGTYNFWDKDSKQRLKAQAKAVYPNGQPAPITCGSFDRTGAIYGYALSYDWSKGYAEYNPATMKPYIMLHSCKEDEVKPKPKAPTAGRK
ncbi:hypothetical protein TSOC_006407 [Tetrabaena socialis]|uniref:Rae1-like protein n=1 Tax=Tetrabaena socialis TaxID=47790 RepID=A0A2J8A3Q2_9CHLO|nr:hypothetical protein TSOC_006407 [Tetrabaena socialis]|eukprot:PNH07150.1 hypothetical protein TSOC_006407 [Tetrabaena socialis]